MIVKIASCEDSDYIRSSLAKFFNKISDQVQYKINIEFFSRGEDLLNKSYFDYDIIFLDIHMGDENKNGIQIAYEIRERDKNVILIFLTGLTQYLKDGYKVQAYRYLTKPISYNELKNETCIAIDEIKRRQNSFLNIKKNSTYQRVPIDDIYYIETDRRKTIIHTKNGKINCAQTISHLGDMLENKRFYRCHNSYLINLIYVNQIIRKNVYINGDEIPISRQKVKDLKDKLSTYLGEFI